MQKLMLTLCLIASSTAVAVENPWIAKEVAVGETIQVLFTTDLRTGHYLVGEVPAATVATVRRVQGEWILLSFFEKGWIRRDKVRRYHTAGECFARRETYFPDFKDSCPTTNSLVELTTTPEGVATYQFMVCTNVAPEGAQPKYEWQLKHSEIPGVCYPEQT